MNRILLASLIASGAMIGATAVGLPLPGILVCGAVSGVAGWLFGQPERPSGQAINLDQARSDLREEANATLQALSAESSRLPSSLKEPTERIAKTAREIQESVGQNSLELSAARRFISEYLKNTLTIVRSYNSLKEKGSERIQLVEPELARLLEKVWQGFVKQKEHLLADDVLRLEVEMKVLQQTIENEG